MRGLHLPSFTHQAVAGSAELQTSSLAAIGKTSAYVKFVQAMQSLATSEVWTDQNESTKNYDLRNRGRNESMKNYDSMNQGKI